MNADGGDVMKDCVPAMGPLTERIINLGVDINFNDLVNAKDQQVRAATRDRRVAETKRISKALPRDTRRR